jgi:hypothetical protein
MSVETELKVKSPKALRAIYEVYGMARIKEALEEKAASYPGFALAQAIVEREFADARGVMSAELLREAARQGVDVGRSMAIATRFDGNKVFIGIGMPDLADEEP